MHSIYTLFVFLLLFSSNLWADIEYGSEGSKMAKVGFVGAQFLKIEVGARGFAMGNAVDPIINDASSVFWNPAGLALSNTKNIFSVKTNWLAGISHSAAAISMPSPIPLLKGNIALSYVSLGTDKMNETTVLQQNGTGNTFSVKNYSIGLGYASNYTHKFSFGIHWKYISENYVDGLSDVSDDFGLATTWAMDVGTIYNTGYKNLVIGMSIRNFGPESQLNGNYYDFENGDTSRTDNGDPELLTFKSHGLPLTFRFGMAIDPNINEHTQLTLSVVGENPADNVERVNFGMELKYLKYFCARAGYVFNHDTRGLSFGFGIDNFPMLSLGKLDADLAISQFSLFDPVMMLSLGIHF